MKFLDFVSADLEDSIRDFGDDFVRCLQQAVQHVKESRAMEERFMVLHEMIKRERAEGKAEGKAEAVIELLKELGVVSEELQTIIMQENDMNVLRKWLKLAARAESVEQFKQNM